MLQRWRMGVGRKCGAAHAAGCGTDQPSCRLDGRMRRGRRFFDYCRLLQDDLMPRYGATEHWAKIEAHRLQPGAVAARLAARFPANRFNAARAALDPKNIMANDVVDALFPRA